MFSIFRLAFIGIVLLVLVTYGNVIRTPLSSQAPSAWPASVGYESIQPVRTFEDPTEYPLIENSIDHSVASLASIAHDLEHRFGENAGPLVSAIDSLCLSMQTELGFKAHAPIEALTAEELAMMLEIEALVIELQGLLLPPTQRSVSTKSMINKLQVF